VSGATNATSRIKGIAAAAYIAGGLGALLFIVAFLLHSRVFGFTGVALMVLAAMLSLPIYRADTTKVTRFIGAASSAWSVLFAIWLVLAALLRAARQYALPIGLVFVTGFLVLAYAWQRNGHSGPVKTTGASHRAK
jgi:hypothetical protein